MSFVAELQRRKVFKVGATYLVVAWLAIQAASIGFPAFDAPPWALRIFILVALLGFPLALVFAWAFEFTPNGVRPESGARSTRAILLIAVVLMALAFVWYFKGQPSYRADTPPPNAGASVEHATPAAPINAKSIAVLPFTDLSPAHDQEYFSDGIAEEILNALAQVKDLKVAGRTSSFYYKGKNENLRAIGKTLGVAHVLEGSVRKQGDKVRITAQLIQVSDDTHLWSHAYDGDLSDVFQLQENIARAITEQLQVVLQGTQITRLVPIATSNADAYALYLQASAIFNRRDGPHYADAIAALQGAIRLDPKFARAHSRLAALYVVLPNFADVNVQDTQELLAENARSASALDPSLAEPWAALGFSYGKFAGRTIDQRKAFERALQLDADDVTTNFWYGLSLVKTGYRARGTALIDHALTLDPMLPNALRWRGILYFDAGDLNRAEQLLNRARDLGLPFADRELADVVNARGDAAMAIRLAANPAGSQLPGLPAESTQVMADGIYGDAAARARAITLIDTYLAQPHEHIPGLLPAELYKLGEPARALSVVHTKLTGDISDFLVLLWSPQGRVMRALPEFAAFLRDFGFVDLWNQYGAPDGCHKDAGGDYACD